MNQNNSYKNSDIEWIGEIPTHWNILKIKNLFSFSKGSGVPKSEVNDHGHSSCILYGELYTKYKGLNVIPENLSRTDLCKDTSVTSMGNEILIPSSTTTTGIDLCNCKTLNYEDVILGGDIIILRPKKQKISREFYSYFISTVSKPQFEMESRGVTIYHIYPKQIREIFVPNLPIDEQNQIVSFLDNKIEKIDNIIKNIEQKIKLQKGQKSLLINESVTRGIDPNIEMKDVGVDWFDEVPKHWEIKKLKYLVKHIKEKNTPGKEDKKISPEYVESDTGICFNQYSDHSGDGYKFNPGDILLNKLRIYLKKFLLVDFDGYSIGEMIVLRTQQSDLSEFIFNCLFSDDLIRYLNSLSTGVKLPRVSPDDILSTKFPLPPIEEIIEINKFIKHSNLEISKKIFKGKRRIELLNEYKQSLISEVVTGKKRVVS